MKDPPKKKKSANLKAIEFAIIVVSGILNIIIQVIMLIETLTE
jgi:hypothetical protein